MTRPSSSGASRQLVLQALSRLKDVDVASITQALLSAVSPALRARRDGDDWGALIQQIRQDLQQTDRALAALQEQVETTAALRPDIAPERWWAAQCDAIDGAEADGRRAEAASLCVESWTDALAVDATDLRSAIVERTTRTDADLALTMMTATGSPDADREIALASLDTLLREVHCPLSTPAAVRLGVLRTRILLRGGPLASADHSAQETLERAEDRTRPPSMLSAAPRLLGLEPDRGGASPEEGLALAALVQVRLRQRRTAQVPGLVARAVSAWDAPSDAFVVAGLAAEAERAWASADEHYVEAVKRGATGWPSAMLRPTPPRLKVVDARRRRAEHPDQAVALYESALKDGIPGDGDHPAVDVTIELARLLRSTDPAGAAVRFAQAAGEYAAAGLSARAAEFYADAVRLRPDVAEYRWWQAESLRLQAVATPGIVDRPLLLRARAAMEKGLELAAPDPGHAWVLISQALLDTPLDGPRPEQLVLLERSLLLDGDRRTPYLFLADQLYERGYVHDALAAAEQNYARHPSHGPAVRQVVHLRIEVGRYADAAEAADEQLWLEPDDADMSRFRALALLRQGEPGQSSDVLQEARPTPWVRLLRAYTQVTARRYDDAEREFGKLYHSIAGGADPLLAGWAAFHSRQPELLETAIGLYRHRFSMGVLTAGDTRDLGQMLLVRGGPDDVAQGEQLLRRGVDTSNSPGGLLQLRTLEFGLVRRYVAGCPHEEQVVEVLRALEEPIAVRRQELLHQVLEPDSAAGLLAAARTALADGAPHTALTIYRRLLDDGELPRSELLRGLARAALATLDLGDKAAAAGALDRAQDSWREVAQVQELLPRSADLDVRLGARRVLGLWAQDRPEAADAAGLADLLDDDRGPGALCAAARMFAGRPALLWAVYDGLTRSPLQADPARRTALRQVVSALPFSAAYRAGRDQVTFRSPAPAVSALTVLLGRSHHDLFRSRDNGIPELRERISTEMGLLIQDVRLDSSSEMVDEVEFRLFKDRVGVLSLALGAAGREERVLERLDQIVRARLYRLIGPDDVGLWLRDWDPARPSALPAEERFSSAERLVFARLLRMLLRENVSIRDREALTEVFCSRKSDDPLVLLRAARLRLRGQLVAEHEPGRRSLLPAGLEERVRIGLVGSGDAWELDRADAWSVLTALRAWLAPGRIVVVHDPAIRPYLWRLLASERPPVHVYAEEELS